MPKLEIDFQKTVIYKIVCKDLAVVFTYVGMTTDFIKRKSNHKANCCNIKANGHNLKVYRIIRENGGWDNWTMLQIEDYPCASSVEARLKEREWYELLNSDMNNNIPLISALERKLYLKQYQISYKILHKDKIAEQAKVYYENNKEKLLNYQNEYSKTHKEEISKKSKDYYEKNKNKV
jgi:hypothetical protein